MTSFVLSNIRLTSVASFRKGKDMKQEIEKRIHEIQDRLFDLEAVIDTLNHDLSKERKENPESCEKFKDFVDAKKKHLRSQIKNLKEELSSLKNETKGSETHEHVGVIDTSEN